MEKIGVFQLFHYLENNFILWIQQAGFRKHELTYYDHLLDMENEIQKPSK